MELYVENSKSKSGKHAIRTLIYLVDGNNIIEYKQFKIKRKIKGIYSLGEAEVIDLPNDKTLVYITMVKTIKNQVKGRVIVYSKGEEKLRLYYRKLKLKLISGDKSYVEIVKRIFESLNIPIKKINLKEVK